MQSHKALEGEMESFMGRRGNTGSFLVLLIAIVLILFVVNNIFVILCSGVLIILSFAILIKQLKIKSTVILSTLKKPKNLPLQTPHAQKHPLYHIFSNILKRYGVNIFNNLQQCRGLLKDYTQNENNKEIIILSDLLILNIPSYMRGLSGVNYYSNVVNQVSNIYFHDLKNIDGYKNCTLMLLDVLNENGLLNVIIKEDYDNPINKIKLSIRKTMLFMGYYIAVFFFYIKNHYRVIIPALLLVSSSILFLINITRSFNDIGINNYKKLAEYIKNQPVNEKFEILPEEIYAFVTASTLNMRRGPSVADSIITQLHQNDKVEILSVEGAWSLVLFNTYKGYVNSSYLSDNPVRVQIPLTSQKQNIPASKPLNLAEKEVKEKE
ncbi:MAG: SH3 domain-containing protein [Bacteroidales bacterium]|jgi:hypothetical protein|nr:SH3 domain-containing protein [Bacteroidales bacterium]